MKTIKCVHMLLIHRCGFTLVELLVALAVSGILMTGIYSAFQSQQDSYLVQEQVAEMQQNLRASLDVITREIRMAGFRGNGSSSATITAAQCDAIAFSADLNEDGDTADNGENIGFDLFTSASLGAFTLGRASSNAPLTMAENPVGSGHYEVSLHQPLSQNVQAIEFYYELANGTWTTSPTATQLKDITSIQISILVRTGRGSRNYMNSLTYKTASGVVWGPYNDTMRRRLEIVTVKCRNMGLR